MKKVLFILVLLTVVSLLVACQPYPTEPKEVLPFCKDNYAILIAGDYPDLPPAYIGSCVAYWQTGKYTAYAPLCSYGPFFETIQAMDPDVTTRQQCLDFLKTFGE